MVTSSVVDDSARAELEQRARDLCASGDHAGAATLAVKGYGAEVFGFLVTMSSSEADASDVFSETTEALWQSLPTFAWQCSLRTWTYAIARNILRSRSRSAARRRKRGLPVSDSSLEQLAQAVRTDTLAFLRTEKRTRLEALRDSLPEDDRMLLVLRVDKNLAWSDVARVLAETEGDGDAPLSDAAITKEAARLRKQFQLVKDRLRTLAKKEGLLG